MVNSYNASKWKMEFNSAFKGLKKERSIGEIGGVFRRNKKLI